MRTRHGFERLLTFADAVVAIALTLLVLPSTEIAGELDGTQGVGEVLAEHDAQLGSFLLSFVVNERGAAPLYDGVLLVSALALTGMAWWGRRRPGLLHRDRDEVRAWRAEPILMVTPAILLVALVLPSSCRRPACGRCWRWCSTTRSRTCGSGAGVRPARPQAPVPGPGQDRRRPAPVSLCGGSQAGRTAGTLRE